MRVYFVKRVTGDSSSLFLSLAILLNVVSYYFVLRYLLLMLKNCYVVINTIAKSVEIQRAVTLVNK
jgi:hypothetical protein